MFTTMEEALSGTALYKNCLSTWPPPFNIASFDLFLLLIILWSFLYPVIRDVIEARISRHRELRWLAEYRRRERRKIELARDMQEQLERLWEQSVMDQEHIDPVEEDYYLDEEDIPQEAEAEMPPQNEAYMTEETNFETDPDGSEEVTEERRFWEEEALTEMDTADVIETVETKDKETGKPQMSIPEIMNKSEEYGQETMKEPEDEYSRLMKKIRQKREDKREAELIAQEQEESRQRNLTEIDRKISERLIAQSIKAEKAHEQDADLERAKKEAANQKQAEAEKRKAREQREQIERMKREKRSSRVQKTHDRQNHEQSDHRSRRRHG